LRESSLARVLLAIYVLLVAYASLYPLAGWRDPGGSAFAFLGAAWPRYVTAFDLGANFLGYVPCGLLCALAARPRLTAAGAGLLAVVAGAALSLALEALQSYLPARIPSNLDVVANVAGAACGGAAGAWLAPKLLGGGPLRRLRGEVFEPGAAADVGLALIGLWLFAQLNPATLLFGTGDLRDLVAGSGERHAAQLFVSAEAVTAAANLVAVALFASAVARPQAPLGRLVAALLGMALVVKALAFAILMQAEQVLAWLTPGAQLGLAGGAVLALGALRLPRTARLAVAALLLMAATVLVNLSPPNPYFAATLKVWEQGHFLNFNGLTRLVSSAWPFAALVYLVVLAAGARRKPPGEADALR
jgi:VanZ family protein/drug/metabolite transporter superfamily protein YnfA